MPESRERLTARKVKAADVINGDYNQQEGFDPNYIITPYGLRVSRARILGTVVDTYINDDESYGAVTIDDGSATIRAKFFQDLSMMDDVEEGDIVEVIGKVKEYDNEIYVNPELILDRTPHHELLRALDIKELRDAWRNHVEKVKQLQDADKAEDDIVQEMQGEGLKEEEVEALLSYVSMEDQFEAGGTPDGGGQQPTAQQATQQGAQTHPVAPGEDDDGDDEEGADEDLRAAVLEAIEELDDGDGAGYDAIEEESGLDEEDLEDVINDLLSDGTCYEPRPGRIKKL